MAWAAPCQHTMQRQQCTQRIALEMLAAHCALLATPYQYKMLPFDGPKTEATGHAMTMLTMHAVYKEYSREGPLRSRLRAFANSTLDTAIASAMEARRMFSALSHF